MNIEQVCANYGITERAFKTLQKKLSIRDIVLLIDDSGSMQLQTRIDDTIKAMLMLMEIALMFDPNGIDVMFLNSTHLNCVIKNMDELNALARNFEASGGTYAGNALNYFVNQFQANYAAEGKPVTLIYIGDGVIDDADLFSDTIVRSCQIPARTPDVKPITFQLFQVGTDDKAAKYFAQLDTMLKTVYNLNDCVDTVNAEQMKGKSLLDVILKALLGSVDDDIDNS